jgi:inositol-phosphate transport system substrate-binding protein
VKAAERLNKELETEGSDKRVEVVVRESPPRASTTMRSSS